MTSEAVHLSQTPTTEQALAELVRLLEDYAPAWYTEEQHLRAMAALASAGNPTFMGRAKVSLIHA